MKLQRYHIAHDGSHVSCIYCSDACVFKHVNGEWIKAEDAEAVEKENEDLRRENAELKQRLSSIKHYAIACSDQYVADICDGKKEDENDNPNL